MADKNNNFYQKIPDGMPMMNNTISAAICRKIFSWLGWSFEGRMPDITHAVLILAPHTSNWDFFIAMVAKAALKLKASYMMKKEAFFWPFKNLLMNIGGIPIDRTSAHSVVTSMAAEFKKQEKLWLVITPEGTRKKVGRFKTGFLRIAHAADVPILVVGLDFKRKAFVFDLLTETKGDFEADADRLYQYCCDNFVAKVPANQ